MTCRSNQLMEKLDGLEFDSEIDSSYYDAAPCANHQQADRGCCADRNGGGDGHDKCDGQSLSEKVLFNYLIFNKILKSCDLFTLKSIRLVCLDWYQASLEVWRKQSVLRLHDWDATPSNAPPAHLSPSKFLQLTQCPPPNNILYWTQHPPQNLRLSKWNIMEPSILRHPEEIWFWRNLSPSLTYLHLDSCTFGPKRFFDLLHKLDHLVHLKINGFERIDGGNDLMTTFGYPTNSSLKTIEIVGPIPFASWNFLQALPGLEAIILRGFSKDYLFDDLKRLRNKNGYDQLSLKTVDIIGTSQRLIGLVEAKFSNLSHLTLQLNAELPEASFTRILEKYGENLQTLKLFRFPIASPEYRAFEGMPNVEFGKLKVLELWGNVIQNWNFLRRTPMLESLKVNLQCFEKIRMIEYWRSRREKMIVFQNERVWDEDKGPFGVEAKEDFKLERMHTLEVDYKFGKKSMTMLGKWMPNLQTLGTIVDKETLQIVCGQWGKLRELRLGFGSVVDDHGIVRWVKGLQKLKTFELAEYCGQSKLSEVAIRQGFMEIEALQNLKICVSPFVSLECEEELTESGAMKNVNVSLIRNYGNAPHFNDFQCCRRVAFLQRNLQ